MQSPVNFTINTALRNYLLKEFEKYCDPHSSDILEIGIGTGRFGNLFGKEFHSYYGIDIDVEAVAEARKNIPKNVNIIYKIGNAENIPFRKKFTIVFYAQSWHFIKNRDKALQEAQRVLKKKGLIFILEPTEKSNWLHPHLQKNSPEFDTLLYEQKMDNLKRGKEAIEHQQLFEVIFREYKKTLSKNIFILGKL